MWRRRGRSRSCEDIAGRLHVTQALTASPERRDLSMSPRAPESATSVPKSDSSRLEASTIAAEDAASRRREATSKPVMSGKPTSSRTMSGRSRSASTTPDSPSVAVPTTTNPSASSASRAVARNDGWSSTINTVSFSLGSPSCAHPRGSVGRVSEWSGSTLWLAVNRTSQSPGHRTVVRPRRCEA